MIIELPGTISTRLRLMSDRPMINPERSREGIRTMPEDHYIGRTLGPLYRIAMR